MGVLQWTVGQNKCFQCLFHGPPWANIIQAPWVCCAGSWDRPNVQSLTHIPPWVGITIVPWVSYTGQWDRPNVQPLSHGPNWFHNTPAPWVRFSGLWDRPNVRSLAHGPTWFHIIHVHGCVAQVHGAEQMSDHCCTGCCAIA
jgi:hypothetical protein